MFDGIIPHSQGLLIFSHELVSSDLALIHLKHDECKQFQQICPPPYLTSNYFSLWHVTSIMRFPWEIFITTHSMDLNFNQTTFSTNTIFSYPPSFSWRRQYFAWWMKDSLSATGKGERGGYPLTSCPWVGRRGRRSAGPGSPGISRTRTWSPAFPWPRWGTWLAWGSPSCMAAVPENIGWKLEDCKNGGNNLRLAFPMPLFPLTRCLPPFHTSGFESPQGPSSRECL